MFTLELTHFDREMLYKLIFASTQHKLFMKFYQYKINNNLVRNALKNIQNRKQYFNVNGQGHFII